MKPQKFYSCPFCGSFFCDTTKLCDHILRKMSTTNSRLKCFCCQKTFSTQRLLKEHMRRHVKKLKCEYCPMTCETPSDLRTHIRNTHDKSKNIICGLCSKTFSRLAALKMHLTKHSSIKEFKCELCDKEFKWKAPFTEHMRLKHSATDPYCYLCHMCPKRFARGNSLSAHLQKKHLIKVPPGFSKFSYKKCEDGFFRLQTERYESVELAAELQSFEASQRELETTRLLGELMQEGEVDTAEGRMASTPVGRGQEDSEPRDSFFRLLLFAYKLWSRNPS